MDAYLRAIDIELRKLGEPREVDTLFFGGGTPTQLGPARLARLIRLVRQWHPLAADYEFSIEANPADLDEAMAAVLLEGGVSRVSLGAQSFDDTKLALLERDHRRADVERAYRLARREVRSVSLDLIFAAPQESLDTWSKDLEQAVGLAPDHVSTYGLTFEKGTSFWSRLRRGNLRQADESLEADMYSLAIRRLKTAGFEHYEVSNFAQPGHTCRHNQVYWTGGQYYAAGPGAARFLDGVRETNHRSTTTYLKRVLAGQSPVAEVDIRRPEDAAREVLVFALRRLAGVDRRWFLDQTGYQLDDLVAEPLKRFVDTGFLDDDGCRLRLTERGLLISDSLWPDFLKR